MINIPPMEEIECQYPIQWEDEYKREGIVRTWSDEFPDTFDGSCGTLKNSHPGNLGSFFEYALMYLLRKHEGLHSLTYYELGANFKKSKNDARRKNLQGTMRKWMGDSDFEKLQRAIQNAGLPWFKGEPDLFCWHPETRVWFFAEAKGKDHLLESQVKWFSVCRETLPNVNIRVYRLKPE